MTGDVGFFLSSTFLHSWFRAVCVTFYSALPYNAKDSCRKGKKLFFDRIRFRVFLGRKRESTYKSRPACDAGRAVLLRRAPHAQDEVEDGQQVEEAVPGPRRPPDRRFPTPPPPLPPAND